MTICRYFAQGWCRFGDRCRFEHLVEDSYDDYNYNQRRQPQRDDRYHWVKSGTQNNSTVSRAASFDFNAALQTARSSEHGGRQRQGWDQGGFGRDPGPRGFSLGGSFIDYQSRPSGGYREPFREEPHVRRQHQPAFGGAVQFDFNKALESARSKEFERHTAEDTDMMEDHGWENGRNGSRRPSHHGQLPTSHEPQSQSAFLFGSAQANKAAPLWPSQQKTISSSGTSVTPAAARGEDYRYTRMEDLEPQAKEQYLAVNFTLGMIPVQPPPLEYCH